MNDEIPSTPRISQICRITIMFVAPDDNEAIKVKRGIVEATKDLLHVRIDFSLNNLPDSNMMAAQR